MHAREVDAEICFSAPERRAAPWEAELARPSITCSRTLNTHREDPDVPLIIAG